MSSTTAGVSQPAPTGRALSLGFEVLDITAKPEKAKGGIAEWAVQSVFANARYSYDNRYLLEGSIRRDGASNLGSRAKYGTLFSISGGWSIHRESWFGIKAFDQLKLRASYGSAGNRPSASTPVLTSTR